MDPKSRKKFTQELSRRSEELADQIVQQASREMPELINPAMSSVMRDSAVSNVELFRDYVAMEGDKRAVRSGPQIRVMARSLAARGQPLSTLIMLFHRAHNILEFQLLNIANDALAGSSSEELMKFLSDLRILTNNYVTIRSDQLPAVFAEEVARLQVPGDPGLLSEVQRVLRDREAAESIGGHLFEGPQLAFLLWGAPGSPQNSETLLRGAREIAAATGAKAQPLMVFSSPNLLWVWCRPEIVEGNQGGRGEPIISKKTLTELLPAGVNVSIGPIAPGVAGFRTSHQIAQRLRRVAERNTTSNRNFIDAGMDGALTAAAFVDRIPLASEIVDVALGELAKDDEYSSVIRATARSFLRHGIAGAATEMVAHRNTVKYRLDKFREVVGKDNSTSTDLRTALELAHWFGPEVLRPVQ